MDELKPCPFCGGAAHIEVDDIQEPEMFWHYSPRCDDWGCLGHMFWFGYDTEEDAVEAWNTRWERRCDLIRIPYREFTIGYEYKCSVCGYSMTDHDSYCSECGARRV